MTNTERSQALRKRRKQAGLREVRGIWLPESQHKRLKDYVKAARVFNGEK